jgi:hypothetical protein
MLQRYNVNGICQHKSGAMSMHTRLKVNTSKTMRKLLQMRSNIGADTLAGRRISNMDEIRQNKVKAAADPVRLAYLDDSLARQLRDFEATRSPQK